MDTGRAKEAEAAYKEALAIGKALAEKHPEVPEYQDGLGGQLQQPGPSLLGHSGRDKEAEAAYKEALAIRTILAEKHPEVPEYQDSLAISSLNLGIPLLGHRPGQGSGSGLQGGPRHSENPGGKASRGARISECPGV